MDGPFFPADSRLCLPPGQFCPEPDSIAAVEKVMRAACVTTPQKPTQQPNQKQY
jgi:hypothetical protein